MQKELLTRLAGFDTCAISDALDALEIKGVALGLSGLTVSRRIVGSAVTVQLGPIIQGGAPARHLGSAAVDSAGPGNIIVVANDGRTNVAGWGGLLSLGAHKRCVEGVVVDGAFRDVDEAKDIGFPIYARASVPVTARGRIVEHGWNVPIKMSGIDVEPGDLVIADGSGVVFFPHARAEEIISRAEVFSQRERSMALSISNKEPISKVMSKQYESLLK